MRENYILYPSLHQPVLTPGQQAEAVLESKFHFPWSEPVRFRQIHVSRIVSGLTWNPQQPLPPTSIWFLPLSEPVRLQIGLRAWHQRYDFQDTEYIPRPDTLLGGWFPPLSEPVRQRIWLKAPYDPDFFYPPRVLPNPDVTAIMAAIEINTDDADFGIDVFTPSPTPSSQAGASVTIVEVPAQQDGAISIREP